MCDVQHFNSLKATLSQLESKQLKSMLDGKKEEISGIKSNTKNTVEVNKS